jgi:hypothetical protein
MVLVRKILRAVEELPAEGGYVEVPEYSRDELRYHLRIMRRAGFIDAQEVQHDGTANEAFWVNGLTWRGHELPG